jgi:hypothetical protein
MANDGMSILKEERWCYGETPKKTGVESSGEKSRHPAVKRRTATRNYKVGKNGVKWQ